VNQIWENKVDEAVKNSRFRGTGCAMRRGEVCGESLIRHVACCPHKNGVMNPCYSSTGQHDSKRSGDRDSEMREQGFGPTTMSAVILGSIGNRSSAAL